MDGIQLTMLKTKKCNTCGKELPLYEFYARKASKDGVDYRCKECSKKYAQWFRDNHPDRAKEIAAKTRRKNRQIIRDRQNAKYKELIKDPKYVEHRRELAKKNAPKNRERIKKRVAEFNNQKKNCEKCGESRKYLIQYHHIDPKTKLFSIGANAGSKKMEALNKETKKCVCLCSNCHDEFHYFYGQKPKEPIKSLVEYLGKDLDEEQLNAIKEFYEREVTGNAEA